MKRTSPKNLIPLLILLFVPILLGFTNVTMTEIQTAIINGDFQLAEDLSEQILASNPTKEVEHEAKYYVGLSKLRMNDYKGAERIFMALTKDNIDSSIRDRAYLGLFEVKYADENYRKANKVIKSLLKKSPDSEYLSLIYLKGARANLKMANWDDATKYLMKITDNYPNSLEYHIARQLLDEKQYFAVQVGSFLDRSRAEQLVTELNKKNEYAYIVETTDQNSRKFYRVRVGRVSVLDEARKLKVKLAKEGYPTQIYP